MKDPAQRPAIDDQTRIILIARVVGVYFLTVSGVIGVILYNAIPLFDQRSRPSAFMLVVWFLYYVAPWILAVSFGVMFKPFWKSFRNIFFTILSIQLLYSFTVSMLRWDYRESFSNQFHWKKSDKIKIIKLTPLQFDRDGDGFIEEVKVTADFDFKKIRPGEYLLDGVIVPGASLSPYLIEGGGIFTINKTGEANIISKDFIVTPRKDKSDVSLALQNFQIKFILFRIVHVSERGKKILQYTRWSPFMRETDWDGADKQIYEDWLKLDNQTWPDVFIMRSPVLEKS